MPKIEKLQEMTRDELIEYAFLMYSLANSITSPIFFKNVEGRYTMCNQAFADYLGIPREKIIGATVYDVAPPDLAEIYDKADRELIEMGGTQDYESTVITKKGKEQNVLFHKAVVKSTRGEKIGIIGVITDITERVTAKRELIREEKINALQKIAKKMAHRINGLLSPIVGQCDLMLLTEHAISEKGRERLMAMMSHSRKTSRLIKEMTVFYESFSNGNNGMDAPDSFFPPCLDEFHHLKKEEKEPEKNQKSGIKILFIDDDEALRIVTEEMLKRLGHEVKTAGGGLEGLALFHEYQKNNPFDLVVVDLQMPNVSGIEVVEQIRLRFPAFPIIVVSGRADHLDPDEAEALRNCVLLGKPMSFSDLVEKIGKAIS